MSLLATLLNFSARDFPLWVPAFVAWEYSQGLLLALLLFLLLTLRLIVVCVLVPCQDCFDDFLGAHLK